VNGVLLFTAGTLSFGEELWRSDGTLAGTAMVQDIAAFTASSSPSSFTSAGAYVFFRANDGSTGQELWAAPLTTFPRLMYLPMVQR
jgi:ELWxxDGT repeat protein